MFEEIKEDQNPNEYDNTVCVVTIDCTGQMFFNNLAWLWLGGPRIHPQTVIQ